MNKLVKFLVATAIGAVLLYVIGFIIALIIIVIVSLIIWIWNLLNPTPEWTEWKRGDYANPIITFLPNGEKVFQYVEWWDRQNNFTGKFESKKVIDPVKRPLDEIKGISNLRYIYHRFY